MKKPVIKERKLGKEQALGLAYNNPKDKKKIYRKKYGIIEIDPRIDKHGGNKGYMDTFIHEALHMIDPVMHEDDVAEMATKLTTVLWEAGYRKVYI